MARRHEIKFFIDAFTPDTLPMWRLAEYMGDLAKLLGEQPSVHFVRLEKGSTVLVNRIDDEAIPKVTGRAREVRDRTAPVDAMEAFKSLNRRLKQDNAVGRLFEPDNAEIIRFPGREEVEPVTFGAFKQDGTLDGVVIRLGGVGDPVPVTLETSDRVHSICMATREQAKILGQFIFGPELRLHGAGRWHRDEAGDWVMDRFTIKFFETLDGEPLSAVIARLRDVPGNEWREMENPWSELERIRGGDGEVN